MYLLDFFVHLIVARFLFSVDAINHEETILTEDDNDLLPYDNKMVVMGGLDDNDGWIR
jgi:hypothetical protein